MSALAAAARQGHRLRLGESREVFIVYLRIVNYSTPGTGVQVGVRVCAAALVRNEGRAALEGVVQDHRQPGGTQG